MKFLLEHNYYIKREQKIFEDKPISLGGFKTSSKKNGPGTFCKSKYVLGKGAKKNLAPVTKVSKRIVKKKNSIFDVNLVISVKDDKLNVPGLVGVAYTTLGRLPLWNTPAYERRKVKNEIIISKFTSPIIWKGEITIQTFYGVCVDRNDLSCYGRGTTKNDVLLGDITVGFHESCHRSDYKKLQSTYPKLPNLKVGMKVSEYDKEIKKFEKAYDLYHKNLKNWSTKTDDCGFTLKTHERTGKCYRH